MSSVVGQANTHGCSCAFCRCVCEKAISTTLSLGEQGPAAIGGHRAERVQLGLSHKHSRTEERRKKEEKHCEEEMVGDLS